MMDNETDVKPSSDDTSSSQESTEDQRSNEDAGDNSKSETSADESSKTDDLPAVDYAGELKKLEDSRDRAQETARFERDKRKELERDLKGKKAGGEEDIDAKINDRVNQVLLDSRADIIDEELDGLTADKTERELIQAIYTKRLNPAAFGYSRRGIKEALTIAKLAANLPRFEAQLISKAKAEAKKEILQEQGFQGSAGGSSTRRQPDGEENKNLNSEERALLARAKKAKENIQRRHF